MSTPLKESSSTISIRPLSSSDYDRGYLSLLSELTSVGEISREQFNTRLEFIDKLSQTYFILVIEDKELNLLVGTATLLIEHKFIHQCGSVGHIEDVVVLSSHRGRNFGQRLIEELVSIAQREKCYKVLLDCDVKNIPFYEKSGFVEKERHLALYFNKKL